MFHIENNAFTMSVVTRVERKSGGKKPPTRPDSIPLYGPNKLS